MEFIEILKKFDLNLKQIVPNKKDPSIEDFLTAFASLCPPIVKVEKDPVFAEAIRTAGNEMFSAGKYKDAAETYTKSLTFAPAYSICAALAYANRSAALYHLNAYQECIFDIDRALDLPYPNNLRPKIISRRELAVKKLNDGPGPDTNNDNKKFIDDLTFTRGINAKISDASDGIDIEYNRQNGQTLVATKQFQPGDLLLAMNPYLKVIESTDDLTHCHNCLKETLCLIPCDNCREVYCSKECCAEAYKNYHRIECTIQHSLMLTFPFHSRIMRIQLRYLNILSEQGANLKELYDDFNEIEDNSNDPKKVGYTGEQFINNTRKAFLSMLWGVKDDNKTNFFVATYIAILLRNHTNFFKKNSDILIVAKIMNRLIMNVNCKYIEVIKHGQKDPKAIEISPLLNLAKEDCINNTLTYTHNDGKIIVRASHPIKPGEQIIFSYHHGPSLVSGSMRNILGNVLKYEFYCPICKKNFAILSEKFSYSKLDKRLRMKLLKNSCDIDTLWQLLNFVRRTNKRYNLETHFVKDMLLQAYEGWHDHTEGMECLRQIRVL